MGIPRTSVAPVRRWIPTPLPGRLDVPGIIETFAHEMMYSIGKDVHTATDLNVYQGLAYAVRDRLVERWFVTQDTYYRADAKRIYYLSMEFLMGRALLNNVLNLGARDAYAQALEALGYDLEAIAEREWDAGLGNGGLGRLAACFLDSAATLALPFYGYGIRYEYGIFRQRIQDGQQVETPDSWLRYGNPWEIPRPDTLHPVKLYGRVEPYRDANGHERLAWIDTEDVMAMAHDMPIAGYRNDTVNSLRLWSAKSSREFDLASFIGGDYVEAVEEKSRTENISKVLYPPDDHEAGRELRLKQEYFFVSATIQDVIRRFAKKPGRRWEELPDKVAFQLNDTHPALAIPELMRVLIDTHELDWDAAWELTTSVMGYTNHTVLPEAQEKWPSDLFQRLLPRHLQIIEEIDRRHLAAVRARHPESPEKLKRMAIVGDDEARSVKMAHLAIVGSHAVNGVARLHTEILRRDVFPDFDELFRGRFTSKTNGITPRRWLLKCNPLLAALVTEAIGERWPTDLDQLARLAPFAKDAAFRERWRAVRRRNKEGLAMWARRFNGIDVDADTIFDCQVKRIHEYKRQLLNVLHVLALRHRILDGEDVPPRTVIFGGKAAPSYEFAKLVIRLIHAVADLVNGDGALGGRLCVAFMQNYGVSCAETIFPACDLSEQISTAGTEASGTGNMKAALNGAVTIGTLDGANIEILEEVGAENMIIFGHTAEEISTLKAAGDSPRERIAASPELQRVVETLSSGEIERAHPGVFRPVVEMLLTNDRYFHCADFDSYTAAQRRASEIWLRKDDWVEMSIRNVAGMGRFSSDRTIREYASEIWKATPLPVKLSEDAVLERNGKGIAPAR